MNFLDLFGPPVDKTKRIPPPFPQHLSKTQQTTSVFGRLFSFKRRSEELEAVCETLHAGRSFLQNENAGLKHRLASATAERDTARQCCDRMSNENRQLKLRNQELEQALEVMKREAASKRDSRNNQETRPDWAKHLDVNDLFVGANTATAKAMRARTLCKIYHPDIRNNPGGLKQLLDHLQTANPSWFRAACHEAYLRIMRNKDLR